MYMYMFMYMYMTGLECGLGHSAVKTVVPIPIPCFEPAFLWLQFPPLHHVEVGLEGL